MERLNTQDSKYLLALFPEQIQDSSLLKKMQTRTIHISTMKPTLMTFLCAVYVTDWGPATNLSLSAVNMTLRSSRRDPNTRSSSRKFKQENRHSKSTCSRWESEGLQSSITCKRQQKHCRFNGERFTSTFARFWT